jgi:hypothetical protein
MLAYTHSCHLEGLKVVHAGNPLAICLHLRTSGRFYDIDLLGNGIKDAVPLWKALSETLAISCLSTTSRIVPLFATESTDLSGTALAKPHHGLGVGSMASGLLVEDLELDGQIGQRFKLWYDIKLVGALMCRLLGIWTAQSLISLHSGWLFHVNW